MFEKLKKIPVGTDLEGVLEFLIDLFKTEDPKSENDLQKTYAVSTYLGMLSGFWKDGMLVHNKNALYPKFDGVLVKDYGGLSIMPHEGEELDEEMKSFAINSTLVELDKTYVRITAGDLCWIFEVELIKEPVGIFASEEDDDYDEVNYGLGFDGSFFGNGGGLPS